MISWLNLYKEEIIDKSRKRYLDGNLAELY